MIYVNFDKYGVLNHIEYNYEVIFKGNNNVNKVFVCFDGIELKPQHYLTYSALINDKDYSGNLTDLASVRTTYNGKDGYMFSIFSNLTKDAGTLKLSIRLVDRLTDAILVSGILPLIVQDSAISTYSNVNITTTQYQALLTAFDDLSQRFNENNFKTINEESLFGEGNITLPTVEYVDSLNNNLRDNVNDKINTLNNADTTLTNRINEQNKIIEKQDRRIKQLELASEGNILNTITEEDIAYEVNATSDALPFAEINKIGGMTYKSDNLIIIDDLAETEKNGIKYRVENGVIYVNGTNTASSTTFINILLSKQILLNGTYSNNWFIEKLGGDIGYCRYQDINGGMVFASDNPNQTQSLNTTLKQITIPVGASKTANLIIKPMMVFVARNLLSYNDVAETTINGITYKVENGVLYYSGTATARVDINVNLINALSLNGNYTLSFLNNQVGGDMRLFGDNEMLNSIPLSSTNRSNSLTYENKQLKQLSFMISSGTSITNATMTPVLVKQTTATAPTTWQVGFEGLRNSAVNQVVVKGANLSQQSTTKPLTTGYFNTTQGAFGKVESGKQYTFSVKYVSSVNSTKSLGLRAMSNSDGGGTNLGHLTTITLTKGQRTSITFTSSYNGYVGLNGSGYNENDEIIDIQLEKGDVATSYKPYKETTYTIPTTITSIDGYDIGKDATYHNYVDFANKRFVKQVKKLMLKDLTWRKSSVTTIDRFIATLSDENKSIHNAIVITDMKGINPKSGLDGTTQYVIVINVGTELCINYGAYGTTTLEDFKAILNEENPSVILPLANPTETDISNRITDDFIIEIEGNGTITFDNEYKNDVPYGWTYQEKL